MTSAPHRHSRPLEKAPSLRLARVCWEIEPAALKASRSASLCWEIDLDQASARARLEVDGHPRELASCSLHVHDGSDGLVHVEAQDGRLIAVLDAHREGFVLFARTTLLGDLGIPGGRYDVVGNAGGQR